MNKRRSSVSLNLSTEISAWTNFRGVTNKGSNLEKIVEIGPEIAGRVAEFFRSDNHREVINRLFWRPDGSEVQTLLETIMTAN